MTGIIPNENRREQTELCQRLGVEAFLNHMWKLRAKERKATLPADQRRTKAKGTWPHVRDADRAPATNIAKLPKRRTQS